MVRLTPTPPRDMTKFLPASPLQPFNSHHGEIGVHKHSIAPQAGGPQMFLPANPLQPLNLHRGEVGVRKHSIAPRARGPQVCCRGSIVESTWLRPNFSRDIDL